jgi:hypothetical protein
MEPWRDFVDQEFVESLENQGCLAKVAAATNAATNKERESGTPTLLELSR